MLFTTALLKINVNINFFPSYNTFEYEVLKHFFKHWNYKYFITWKIHQKETKEKGHKILHP